MADFPDNGVHTFDGVELKVECLILNATLLDARVVGREQLECQVDGTPLSVLVLYFYNDVKDIADDNIIEVLDLKLYILHTDTGKSCSVMQTPIYFLSGFIDIMGYDSNYY